MEKTSRILVFGGSGLAGSAIVRNLKAKGYTNVVFPSSKACDCGSIVDVIKTLDFYKPEYIILAAAKVGGIKANSTQPYDFIADNLMIQTNVITVAGNKNINPNLKKLIFLGSSCIYPKNCPQPIKEEYLLTGPLEPTNQPYALAKIAGIELCKSMNKQYGTEFISVMPCNLYGIGDNYDEENGHVIPGIISRMHTKKIAKYRTFFYWGTGRPLREFLYADDLAEAIVQLLEHKQKLPHLINIGSYTEISIRDLTYKIAVAIGYSGRMVGTNDEDLDGTPRKVLDCSLLKSILPNWHPKVQLDEGLKLAYKDFLDRYTHEK